MQYMYIVKVTDQPVGFFFIYSCHIVRHFHMCAILFKMHLINILYIQKKLQSFFHLLINMS